MTTIQLSSLNIADSIIESVQSILNNYQAKAQVARTLIGTVVSAPTTGICKVKYNNYTITASVLDDKTYDKDEQVYILDIFGDFSGDVIVLGNYTASEPIKYAYTNPLSGIIKADDFKANNVIKAYPIPEQFKEYDYFAVAFGLTTKWLKEEVLPEEYSINFTLIVEELIEGETPLSIMDETYTIKSAELFGNPFEMFNSLRLEHVFKLSENIKNNFKNNRQLKLVANTDYTGKEEWNSKIDLDIQEAYLAFDGAKIPEIVTLSNQTSVGYLVDNEDKTYIYTYLFNKDDIKLQLYGINNKLPENIQIDWNYQDETSAEWQSIEGVYFNKILNSQYSQYQVKYSFSEEDYLYTNILKYQLDEEDRVISNIIQSKEQIEFSLSPGDNGVYNLYGVDNRLLVNKQYKKITANIKGQNWDKSQIEYVKWKIPKKGCTIEPYTLHLKSDEYENISDEEFWEYHDYKEKKNEFSYTFKDYHDPIRQNNIIQCTVVLKATNQEDEAATAEEKTGTYKFIIGSQGNSGLKYSLNTKTIENKTIINEERYINKPFLIAGNTENIITYKAILENDQGIQFKEQEFSWEIYQGSVTTGQEFETLSIFNGTLYLAPLTINGVKYPVNINNYLKGIVFKLSTIVGTENNEQRTLTSLISIPIVADTASEIFEVQGPTRVVYGVDNSNPSYDSESSYALSGYNLPITWELSADALSAGFRLTKENKLLVPTFYNGEEKNYSAIAKNELGEIIAVLPLIVTANQYGSSLLNEWSGNSIIDTSGNKIMTGTLAVGEKNANNTFTGIFMGKVENTFPMGIYGYNQGIRRFSFDKNGDTFIMADGLRINSNHYEIKKTTFGEVKEYKGGIIQCYELKPELDENGHEKKDENSNIIYQESERIRIGYVRTEQPDTYYQKDIYGIDIYEGAFRMYGCNSLQAQNANNQEKKDLASIYFETEKKNIEDNSDNPEMVTNMYLNGELNRTYVHTYKNVNEEVLGQAKSIVRISNNIRIPRDLAPLNTLKHNLNSSNNFRVSGYEEKLQCLNISEKGKQFEDQLTAINNNQLFLGQTTLQDYLAEGDLVNLDSVPSGAVLAYILGKNNFADSGLSIACFLPNLLGEIDGVAKVNLVAGIKSSNNTSILEDNNFQNASIEIMSGSNNSESQIFLRADDITFKYKLPGYSKKYETIKFSWLYDQVKKLIKEVFPT